ncbi:MAG TPA: hypothetical protein VGS04_00985 [Nitrososphaerales archaeon]|nr:hypothetical protein [Nitrososphaerales archaeon]
MTFRKSPGFAPIDLAAGSVERTNGNSCGDELYFFRMGQRPAA